MVILLYFLSTYSVKLLHKIPIINIAKQNHEKMAPKKCNQLKLVVNLICSILFQENNFKK